MQGLPALVSNLSHLLISKIKDSLPHMVPKV